MKNLLVLFVALALCSMDNPKMNRTKMTEGVSVLMPKDFVPMPEDDIANKYPSTKKPLAVFTSLDRQVDFGLNVSKAKFPGNDLKVLKGLYKSTLIQAFEKVEFLQDTMKTINGKNFFIFEVITEADKIRKYSYLQYTTLKTNPVAVKSKASKPDSKEDIDYIQACQMLIFNFTVPIELKDTWRKTAGEMMNSVTVQPNQIKLPDTENPQERKGKNTKEVLEQQKQKSKK